MKLLIVGGLSTDPEDVASLEELVTYLQKLVPDTTETVATHLDLIQYSIEPEAFRAYDSHNKHDLADFDHVFIRGPKMRIISEYAYYLSKYCRWNNIRFWNDYSMYYPGTKFAQAIIFLEQKVPFLKTLYSVNRDSLLEQSEKLLGYPFILKTSVGSHGDSNYLIHSKEEIQRAFAKEAHVKFLTQAFCPNDRDYRVLLMQDKPLVFERRGSAETHINNTSKGGEAAIAQDVLPVDIIEQCKKVAAKLRLTIAGVDVMPHLETGQFYFLEINTQPQLRTGVFLEEKQRLLKKMLT